MPGQARNFHHVGVLRQRGAKARAAVHDVGRAGKLLKDIAAPVIGMTMGTEVDRYLRQDLRKVDLLRVEYIVLIRAVVAAHAVEEHELLADLNQGAGVPKEVRAVWLRFQER